MGCWHGYGPCHGWPPPRGWYVPAHECDWYEDVNRPLRRRARERPADREFRATSIEARLEELREELRRVEAALEDIAKLAGVGPSE